MMTAWASVQSVLFAVCTEKDWSNWIMGWDIRLLTVAVAVSHACVSHIDLFIPIIDNAY